MILLHHLAFPFFVKVKPSATIEPEAVGWAVLCIHQSGVAVLVEAGMTMGRPGRSVRHAVGISRVECLEGHLLARQHGI